jgi:hypothetical protein
LDAINEEKEYGFNINMSKVVIVNRQPHDDAILYINPIERMSKFKYLGSILKWDSDREVKIKAAMTKAILT